MLLPADMSLRWQMPVILNCRLQIGFVDNVCVLAQGRERASGEAADGGQALGGCPHPVLCAHVRPAYEVRAHGRSLKSPSGVATMPCSFLLE